MVIMMLGEKIGKRMILMLGKTMRVIIMMKYEKKR